MAERLIDANALKKAIADAFYNLHEIAYITDIIERQPTIEPELNRINESEVLRNDK